MNFKLLNIGFALVASTSLFSVEIKKIDKIEMANAVQNIVLAHQNGEMSKINDKNIGIYVKLGMAYDYYYVKDEFPRDQIIQELKYKISLYRMPNSGLEIPGYWNITEDGLVKLSNLQLLAYRTVCKVIENPPTTKIQVDENGRPLQK